VLASGQASSAALKPTLVQKGSRIKLYKALTLPIFLYGKEIWTLRIKDKKTDINRD
jgi:hypothetical protein